MTAIAHYRQGQLPQGRQQVAALITNHVGQLHPGPLGQAAPNEGGYVRTCPT